MNSSKKIFSWQFKLDQLKCLAEQIILNIPDVVQCRIRKIGSGEQYEAFERKENYDGRKPGYGDNFALEATLFLTSEFHPEWNECTFGIPLSELDFNATFTLQYNGVYFSLFADRKLVTDNYTYGNPPGILPENIAPASDAVTFSAWSQELITEDKTDRDVTALHTWSPDGLNAWAGDVSLLYENGNFHIFYLFDRRHHGSKFGQGGHQWAHLVSRDLRTWKDHGVVLPFYKDHQTYGTGTPFQMGDKLILTYGLHTGRIIPNEEMEKAPDRYLRGATWAESIDGGKTFHPTDKIFHLYSENPSVYRLDDSTFLFHNGVDLRTAETFPDFVMHKESIFPEGEESVMRNCRDCPAWFTWHEKHFMIMGFSGMWMDDAFDFPNPRDLAAEALDIYDGIQVPMVAPYENDRRIMVGWLPITGWGGIMLLRELVWDTTYNVPGTRFLEEALPDLPCKPCPAETAVESDCFFELDCHAGENVVLRFEGTGGDLEFRLDAAAKRASLSRTDGMNPPCSLRENAAKGMRSFIDKTGGMARENIPGLDKTYKLRFLLRYERKWNGCVLDFEIASCRTIIGYFNGVKIHRITHVI